MEAKFKHAGCGAILRIPLLLSLWICGFALVYAGTSEEASVSQQSRTVTGVISDSNGELLSGAIVKLVGSTTGTTADLDGKYSIVIPGSSAILSFAYMGYTTQQITVGEKTIVDVVLKENAQDLDEVVVIGYGTTRKRDLVGAVGHISGKALADKPNMNISRALQGAVPGLNISMRDGKPSRGATLDLRGTSSIGAGGDPLILIDGVEAHGDLTTVNPSDVESISVLKDASSAAIYGAKGAFGVILITTKSPSKGKPKVNYSGNVSMHQRTNKPDIVTNGLEFVNGFRTASLEGKGTIAGTINNVFKYSESYYQELIKRDADPTLEKIRVNGDGLYEYFGNTDWFDIVYKDHNYSQEHNLNVSGGDDRIKYYVSGRYFNQDGIYNDPVKEDYKQYNLRAKGSIKINKYLTLENNTDFLRRTIHQPMVMYDRQNIQRQLDQQAFPMTMPKNPDGTWTEAAVYTGWAGFVEGTSFQQNNKFDLKSSSALTYTPMDNLILKADFSYYYNQSERDRAENQYKFYTGVTANSTRNTFSSLDHVSYHNQYESSNVTANWLPKFKNADHHLNLLGGFNVEHKYTKNVTTYRRGLILPEMPTFHLLDGEFYTVDQSGSEWAYFGVLYRANYNYKDKYLAEFSGRYDGSSKFPSNQQWGFFPSASVGWRMSEEKFMDWSNAWLDNFKIRLSAGSMGNGEVDPFLYISTMPIAKTTAIIGDGLQVYTYAPNNIPQSLTWETSTTYDAGLDIDVLSNRLNIILDYYHRYTTDMFTIGPELPAVFGATSPKGNYADLKTKGWEVSLSWRDQFYVAGKPFGYNVKAMLWDNRSWVTKYNNPQKNLGSDYYVPNYYEGMEIGEIWGYHIEGLFRDQEDIDSHADQTAIKCSDANILKPGDLKYADLDESGVVNSGENTANNPGDRRIIGNTAARYQFGFNLGATWNRIGISAFIQGIGKKDWYPRTESSYFWGQYNHGFNTMLKMHTGDNVWTEENQNFDAYWPRYRGWIALDANKSMRLVNDRYLQNVAYVRLKSMQIDYTFSRKICDFLHITDLKVYVAGDNLFTWSPLYKITRNFDPEGINAGDSDFRSAVGDGDGYGYPMQSSYTFGVNLTF